MGHVTLTTPIFDSLPFQRKHFDMVYANKKSEDSSFSCSSDVNEDPKRESGE